MSIGAGRPKFRIWLTMSAGWNMNIVPGNFLRQIDAELALVLRDVADGPASAAPEDVAVGAADHAGVRIGGVDAAVGQADVVEDAIEITWPGMSCRIACSI